MIVLKHLWVAIALLASLVTSITVDLEKTHDYLGFCYNDTRYTEERLLPALSLDNLLAIIERIENEPFYSAKFPDSIAGFLINRFRIDGISRGPHDEMWDTNRGSALHELLDQNGGYLNWPIDFISLDDKCALHWMLSHNVNNTRTAEQIPGWEPTRPPLRRRRQAPYNSRQYNEDPSNPYSKYPRESGVMYTSPVDAIAAGSLLAGIAMMKQDRSVEIRPPVPVQPFSINKMHAVSYGLNLALPRVKGHLSPGEKFLGPSGFWNETICPTEFTLAELSTTATDAIVNGGFDGFFIARHLSKISKSDAKLSHILRMYYNDGFPSNRAIRSCNRTANIQELIAFESRDRLVVRDEIANAMLYYRQIVKSGPADESTAKVEADKILTAVAERYTTVMTEYPSSTTCQEFTSTSKQKVIPRVDLYVIVDRNYITVPSYLELTKLVAYIADYLDVAPYASHIGVYVDDKKTMELFPLNITETEAEWKCRVKRYSPYNFPRTNTDDTIDTIRTLKERFIKEKALDRDRIERASVPGKVVLFVRSTAVPNHEAVRWEMELFRKDHPEIKILGAGLRPSDLQYYLTDSKDFTSFSNTNAHQSAKLIVENHLTKVGNLIYIPKCESEWATTHDFHSYLPPFAVQYHQLPSTMFNLSSNLKVEVKSDGVELQACIVREIKMLENPSSSMCTEVALSGMPIISWSGDPCKDYTAGYCPPMYITVKRKDPASPNYFPCPTTTTKLCRTFEDARYTIKVTDARCVGSTLQLAVTLIFTWLLAVFVSKL